MKYYSALLAEWAGTFAMVFCGTGAMVINDVHGGVITHTGVAMTWGLIVASMIFALGDVSGAHLNPAVTLSFAISRRFPWSKVGPYVLAQTAGAFSASILLLFLFPLSETLGATLPVDAPLQSFVLEWILTFILVLVIFNVSSGSREKGITAAIAIGGVVGLEAMFAGPVSGASMNPARSLAPAMVSGHTEHLWVYLLAPMGGAVTGMLFHNLLYSKK